MGNNMATSPSHRFGQIIGDLLEEIMGPKLQEFCDIYGFYLDKKGSRGNARAGKKVTWEDKFGNSHDLDFVFEKGGTSQYRGRPIAFIEAAWRRYTKHSRNKTQEIQGAILPIAEKYSWDAPFLGTVLAGEFTDNSLTQMKTSGFEVMYFPYETVISAFLSIGISVEFDESTEDIEFQKAINAIESLNEEQRNILKGKLIKENADLLNTFLERLSYSLSRQIDTIILTPLHGKENVFEQIKEVLDFIQNYSIEDFRNSTPRKFEIIVRYNNASKIEAQFSTKIEVIEFLNYISMG